LTFFKFVKFFFYVISLFRASAWPPWTLQGPRGLTPPRVLHTVSPKMVFLDTYSNSQSCKIFLGKGFLSDEKMWNFCVVKDFLYKNLIYKKGTYRLPTLFVKLFFRKFSLKGILCTIFRTLSERIENLNRLWNLPEQAMKLTWTGYETYLKRLWNLQWYFDCCNIYIFVPTIFLRLLLDIPHSKWHLLCTRLLFNDYICCFKVAEILQM